ncbi:hypothetical protein E4L96_01775 [Massilia arenosa]|uniref:DUF2486 family protein n=1 Tax=Zemynaea arenosa TaxID=2561931 RepID=A0A4Y9SRP5_9BURK|nr:hypothetical protein [Massilia arenosa]TFW29145.1 hypothetical protein E4L96_01775 [Massilia arenosa]
MSQTPFDASIPVLTEVFADEPAATAPAPAAPAAPDDDWARLERQVSERVLHALQSRTDFVLEQRVRDAMAEVLDRALKDLTSEIRAGLHQTLEKIVARAVAQEIAHLQTLKK